MIAVVMVSVKVNIESNPRVRSMQKKRNDHKGGTGMLEMASGYATNARAGPLFTISLTSTLFNSAIKPRIEKMTKPAKTEVPQLMNETSKASL